MMRKEKTAPWIGEMGEAIANSRRKKDGMERCQTCRHLDKEKSNENWVVCMALMPLDVILNETSKDCEKHEIEKVELLKRRNKNGKV